MFDEITVECCPHWDDTMNQFLSVCQEHGHSLGLGFCSLQEVEELCEAVSHDEEHLALEVCMWDSVSSFSFLTIFTAGHGYGCQRFVREHKTLRSTTDYDIGKMQT